MINKRPLGRTNLNISEIGFGCGGVWGSKLIKEKKAINLVRSAYNLGINYFDTGASYSGGNAEIRLGKALSTLPKEKVIVGTKAGTHIGRNGKLYKDFSPKALEKSVAASLRNLGIDRLTILQLHCSSLQQIEEKTLRTLEKLKQRGDIGFIGISTDGDVLDWAIEQKVFDCVMLTYNVLKQSPVKQIIEAHKKGLAVLVKSPMAHTLYSNKIFGIRNLSGLWYFLRVAKNYRKEIFLGRKYRFLGNNDVLSSHQLALKFVLMNKYISCAVTGTTDLNHLKENMKSANMKIPLPVWDRMITQGGCLALHKPFYN
ncbi:aldo/keto reductase [Pseudomonadota bacterium]